LIHSIQDILLGLTLIQPIEYRPTDLPVDRSRRRQGIKIVFGT